MSSKSAKIAGLIESLHGQAWDARYLGYFHCFNQGLYYEAHDVLEDLWLPSRGTDLDGFYKALIQLAGGFVHLQKDRLKPAAALFRLSLSYLGRQPLQVEGLRVESAMAVAREWLDALEACGFSRNPLVSRPAPTLALDGSSPDSRAGF